MSSRDTLTMTRVPSLRSSPKRNNLLSSVSETCEEDWDTSRTAANPNCERELTENHNTVQGKLVVKNEGIVPVENIYGDIEISEPSIKVFLAKDIECSVQSVNNPIPNPGAVMTTDREAPAGWQDAPSQACEDTNLTEIQQLREQISSDILSIDPLTRKKISSMQHCRSFDHADSEDEVAVSLANKKEVVCPKSQLYVPPEAEEEEEEGEGSSQEEDESVFVGSRSRVTRNPSYQRAVTKACKMNRFSIDVAVTDDVSGEGKGLSNEKSKVEIEPQNATSISPQPATDTSGSVVSRSVSFNERLLESTTKIVDSTLSSRSNSSDSRKDNSTSTTCSRMIRQMSTPTSAKPVPSLPSYKSFDIDVAAAEPSSDTNSQRKISLKTITSNFSKKFTSKSSKAEKKQEAEKANYLQMVNGVPPSESSAAVVSYEGLLRLFECPGCQTLMLPPFLQCKKGHLLCDKCKVSFKGTCPQCKQRIADSTNYMMEQVCNLVRFPCKFGQFGCSEFYPPRQKTEHEHFCHHRPVHCHFESNGCTKILPLKDMKQHLDDCQWKSS